MGTLTTLASHLNHEARLNHARRITELALEASHNPVCSTKFTPDSAVFLHLITRSAPSIPVVWVDTGYNSRATLVFAEELVERLNLNLHVFRPQDHTLRLPPALDDPEHAAFTREVKLEPFQRALSTLGADLWLSSIRRYQTAYRQQLDVFLTLAAEAGGDGQGVKAAPMLDWSADTVERYRLAHSLPKGPDCFDPTKGEGFRECGLHTMG